jgi:hypothetical protein
MLGYAPRRARARRRFRIALGAIIVTISLIGCEAPGALSGSPEGPLGSPSASATPTPSATPSPSPSPKPTDPYLITPPPGLGEQKKRLLPKATAPPGTDSYKFLAYNQAILSTDTSDPIRWDPCRPIHYVIRDKNTPYGGDEAIREAINAISAATGLVFIEDGPTNEVPSLERHSYMPTWYGKRWAPLLIAWSDPGEIPNLAGRIAGVATPLSYQAEGEDGPAHVSGWVYLDAPDLTADNASWGSTWPTRSVVMHELGHAMGLAHVSDPAQLMYSDNVGLREFGTGDLRGLAIAGSGTCHPEL